jgi:hypothetical protein
MTEHRVSDLVNDQAIVAVKVWSDKLWGAVWVVVEDLPRNQRPTDAPVYTHGEVKILRGVGQEPLAWVHAIKRMFGAVVVSGGRRSEAANNRT